MSAMDVCNAAVAVSPVVVFAKFVTHRSRTGGATAASQEIRGWHTACILLGSLALLAATVGLAWSAEARTFAWIAALLLALSFTVLIADGLSHDLNA